MLRYKTNIPIPKIESLRILLIEDDSDVMDLSKIALEKYFSCDLELFGVSSLIAAISLLTQDSNFDVIVTDLNLPDAQNVEAVTELSKLNLDIPIVVLTVCDGPAWPKKLLLAGASDYLNKSDIVGSLGRAILNTKIRHELIKHLQQALIDKDDAMSFAQNQIRNLEKRLATLESQFLVDES